MKSCIWRKVQLDRIFACSNISFKLSGFIGLRRNIFNATQIGDKITLSLRWPYLMIPILENAEPSRNPCWQKLTFVWSLSQFATLQKNRFDDWRVRSSSCALGVVDVPNYQVHCYSLATSGMFRPSDLLPSFWQTQSRAMRFYEGFG